MSSTTVEINARETVSKAALEARKGISGLKSEAESSAATFGKVAAVAGTVSVALYKLGQEAVECFKEFADQERSIAQFSTAMELSNTITTSQAEALRKYAEEMANLTGEDDEAIMSMEAFLAASGRNETQIRKLISAAADYSAATGKDMRSAVEELNKTFSGSEGRIGALVPALKGLTDEQLKAGKGIDVVAKQYEGFAAQMSNITDVRLKNLSNAWGDLRAAFGANAAAALSPFLEWLTNLASGWAKAGQEKAAYYDIRQPADDVAEVTARGNIRRVVDQLDLAYLAQRMAKTTGNKDDISAANTRVEALQKELDKWIFSLQKILGRWQENKPGTSSENGSSGGGADEKTLKANYKTVSDIYTDLQELVRLMGLNYYSGEESGALLDAILKRTQTAGSLALGPEGSGVLARVWETLAKAFTPKPINFAETSASITGYNGATGRTGMEMSESVMIRSPIDQITEVMESTPQGISDAITAGIEYADSELVLIIPPLMMALSKMTMAIEDFPVAATEAISNSLAVDETISRNQGIRTNAFSGERPGAAAFFTNGTLNVDPIAQVFTDFEQWAMSSGFMATPTNQGEWVGGTEIGNMLGGITGIGDIFGNLLGSIGPLIASFGSVVALLNPLETIFSAAMDVLAPLINTILQPLVGILRIVGATIGQILAPILSALAPVIKIVGDAFIFLYNNVIRHIANTWISIGNMWANSIIGIINGLLSAYNWMNDLWRGEDAAMVEYRAIDAGYLGEINTGDLNAAGSTSSTGTGGAGATYEKPRDITINVQITTAALVGDGGITDFASIIGRELRSLGVLNAGVA